MVLRGLTIQGTGGSGDGIDFNSGAALHVENCVINGVGNYGIDHTGSGSLFVNDTVIRNSFNGVELDNSAAHEALSRVRLEFNISYGLSDDSGVASIANSVISDNGYIGISSGGSGAEVSVESCLLPHNFNGIANSGGGIIRVSNTTVTDGGGTGFYSGAGTFYSRQNNTVAGNFPRPTRHDQPARGHIVPRLGQVARMILFPTSPCARRRLAAGARLGFPANMESGPGSSIRSRPAMRGIAAGYFFARFALLPFAPAP